MELRNKEKKKHIRHRSGAKNYIKNATKEELLELQELITERINIINKK